ncbi:MULTISPECIES: methyltransferase [Amycolatopsis]|uniref:Methyltransferase n=1 Tax=Amycolatopsis albidoflavus TaxID=102226 RepID=A0ABW5I6B7_9PSEU
MTGPPRRAQISQRLEMLPPIALRVAATLGLADLMESGLSDVEELAAAAGCDADALGRLLRYLAQLNVCRAEDGGYRVTPAGRLLRKDHPAGLAGWLDLDTAGGRMDLALTGLLHAVRTGEPGYDAVFGRSFWADLGADETLSDSFDRLMAGKAAAVAGDLAAHADFSGGGEVVDVGGGSGQTLAAILRAHPDLRGCLFDQPGPVRAARRTVDAAGVASRCRLVEGSFLDGVPAGGAVYLLVDILHDWDDRTAERILRACAAAARPGARILVVERIPDEDMGGDGAAADLKMLVLFAGRQRNAARMRELVAAAGISPGTVQLLPSGFSVFEGRVEASAIAG